MHAILTYHSVDSSGSAISISEPQFAAHVRWLASGAVRVVPLETIASDTSDDAVALTFDDGFSNFAEVAWPMLRRHRLPATVFVVSDRVGASNAWSGRDAPGIPTLPLMDWTALARIAQEGATLGAHSMTHPDLRTVDEVVLANELDGSARVIAEHTGCRPLAFAYPYGATDARVTKAAGRTFQLAVTTDLRLLGPREDRLRLPRLDAFYLREDGRLDAWGTPAFRGSIWLRRLARRGRASLRRGAS